LEEDVSGCWLLLVMLMDESQVEKVVENLEFLHQPRDRREKRKEAGQQRRLVDDFLAKFAHCPDTVKEKQQTIIAVNPGFSNISIKWVSLAFRVCLYLLLQKFTLMSNLLFSMVVQRIGRGIT
jgi:hypothetical protein